MSICSVAHLGSIRDLVYSKRKRFIVLHQKTKSNNLFKEAKAMKERTKVKKMFVLDGGSFTYEEGMMKLGKDLDKHRRVFTPFFAFDTEEGWILYDTGWPLEALPLIKAVGLKPEFLESNSAEGQLKKIGVAPGDVSKVIISHLHADHAGGLKYFPQATVCVQKDEYAYALHPNSFQALSYYAAAFSMPNIKWNFLEGDEVLIPGMYAILANGHTPGLQGLVVELPDSGYYILGADSAYLTENIVANLPPGNSWNPIVAQYSIRRLKTLAMMLGGRHFPGHDYDFFTKEVSIAQAYV